MKIKRYEIVPDLTPGQFRVIDKLLDEAVCIPLHGTREDMLAIMGKDMDELVDSKLVHPGHLQTETPTD